MISTIKCPYNEYCESKTDQGYCGRTGGCSKVWSATITLPLNYPAYEVGTFCLICGAFLKHKNYPQLCPECKERLLRVLYPEKRENEHE